MTTIPRKPTPCTHRRPASREPSELEWFHGMWVQREVEARCRPLPIINVYDGYVRSFIDWLQRQQRLTLHEVTTDSVAAYLRSVRPRLTKGAWNGTRAALWLWTTWLFRQGYLQQCVDCSFDIDNEYR